MQCLHVLSLLGVAHTPDDQALARYEEFICRLYESVHTLRCKQFRKGKGKLENLPPTRDALLLHIRQAHFQALVRQNSLVPNPDIPCPTKGGWHLNENKLVPTLMIRDGLSAECLDGTTCGCTKTGRQCKMGQCSCNRIELQCTGACIYQERCQNLYNFDNDSD